MPALDKTIIIKLKDWHKTSFDVEMLLACSQKKQQEHKRSPIKKERLSTGYTQHITVGFSG